MDNTNLALIPVQQRMLPMRNAVVVVVVVDEERSSTSSAW